MLECISNESLVICNRSKLWLMEGEKSLLCLSTHRLGKNFTLERTQEEDTNGMGNLLEMLKMTQLQLFHCCYQKMVEGIQGRQNQKCPLEYPWTSEKVRMDTIAIRYFNCLLCLYPGDRFSYYFMCTHDMSIWHFRNQEINTDQPPRRMYFQTATSDVAKEYNRQEISEDRTGGRGVQLNREVLQRHVYLEGFQNCCVAVMACVSCCSPFWMKVFLACYLIHNYFMDLWRGRQKQTQECSSGQRHQ